MPTNLGDLYANRPVPNGKIQIKRGVEGSVDVANITPYGTKLSDGAGGFYEISYTPTYACYWVVRANVMAHQATGNVWQRWDYRLNITPADADGATGITCIAELHTSLSWRTFVTNARFRLNPGIAYTAFLTHQYSTGDWHRYHTNGLYTRLVGRIVGEGTL
jgi:hypothetical protein